MSDFIDCHGITIETAQSVPDAGIDHWEVVPLAAYQAESAARAKAEAERDGLAAANEQIEKLARRHGRLLEEQAWWTRRHSGEYRLELADDPIAKDLRDCDFQLTEIKKDTYSILARVRREAKREALEGLPVWGTSPECHFGHRMVRYEDVQAALAALEKEETVNGE